MDAPNTVTKRPKRYNILYKIKLNNSFEKFDTIFKKFITVDRHISVDN